MFMRHAHYVLLCVSTGTYMPCVDGDGRGQCLRAGSFHSQFQGLNLGRALTHWAMLALTHCSDEDISQPSCSHRPQSLLWPEGLTLAPRHLKQLVLISH